MTDSKTVLAERVFDRMERLQIPVTCGNMFATALILWDEDNKKISKGFDRVKVAGEEPPARSSRHDVDE